MLIRSLMPACVRSPDGGGVDPVVLPAPAPAPTGPKTFSEDYVRELREENATWRRKASGHEGAAKTATETAEAAKREAEAAVAKALKEADDKVREATTAAQTKADERVIRAELRAAAIKAGMVDLDAIKLLDASALKINDDGDVDGVDALIDAAKKAKPYLFGGTGTGNPTPPPPPKAPGNRPAKDMTDAEFDAAMKSKSWRS